MCKTERNMRRAMIQHTPEEWEARIRFSVSIHIILTNIGKGKKCSFTHKFT